MPHELVIFDGSRIPFKDIVVHIHDLKDSTYLEWLSVFLCEALDNWSELRVVVARHGWEQMMFKLVLHSTEEVLCDGIITADSTCCSELISGKAILSVCG